MGGSGGGSSGAVSWPDYLQNTHSDWLSDTGSVTVSAGTDMTSLLNDAHATNPLATALAYPPGTHQVDIDVAIGYFLTRHDAISEHNEFVTHVQYAADQYDLWYGAGLTLLTPTPVAPASILAGWVAPVPTAHTNILALVAAEAEIADDVDAFGDVIDDQITTTVLPRFQAGMVDINAVMSSAFVIGAAIIEGMRNRDVAKYQGELRTKAFLQKDQLLGQAYMENDKILAESLGEKNKSNASAYIQNDKIEADDFKAKNLIEAEMVRHRMVAIWQGADSILQAQNMRLSIHQALTQFSVDAERVKYVMYKEERDRNIEIALMRAKWDLEVFQYGSNLLAAVSGGTGYASSASALQSTLGGAFAGAGIGARVSGNSLLGAGAGAILGGIGGYLLGR